MQSRFATRNPWRLLHLRFLELTPLILQLPSVPSWAFRSSLPGDGSSESFCSPWPVRPFQAPRPPVSLLSRPSTTSLPFARPISGRWTCLCALVLISVGFELLAPVPGPLDLSWSPGWSNDASSRSCIWSSTPLPLPGDEEFCSSWTILYTIALTTLPNPRQEASRLLECRCNHSTFNSVALFVDAFLSCPTGRKLSALPASLLLKRVLRWHLLCGSVWMSAYPCTTSYTYNTGNAHLQHLLVGRGVVQGWLMLLLLLRKK